MEMADTDPWWWTIRTARQELSGGHISHTEYLAALQARTIDRSWLNAFAYRAFDDTVQGRLPPGRTEWASWRGSPWRSRTTSIPAMRPPRRGLPHYRDVCRAPTTLPSRGSGRRPDCWRGRR